MQILRYTFFIMLLYSFNVSAMYCPDNVTNITDQNQPMTDKMLLGRQALDMLPMPAKKANVNDNKSLYGGIGFVYLSLAATALFYVYANTN